jgi:hypothetical protein
LYFNARSLNNKLSVLKCLLQGTLMNCYFDLVFVCETWLTTDCPHSMLVNDTKYSVIRADRVSGVGGGVCIFYNSTVNCVKVNLLDKYSHLELLCADVYFGRVKQRFILCYNPPAVDAAYVCDLCECLDNLCNIDYVFTIVGDFNMPNIVWSDLSVYDARCSSFVNFIINNGLSQFVHEPTRGNNILDLILSNDSHAVFDVLFHPPFSTSDHLSLSWNAWFPGVIDKECDRHNNAYNFARADYDALDNYLSSVNWVQAFSTCHPLDIEGLWLIFKQVLFDVISVCVPIGAPAKSSKRKYPRYIHTALSRKKVLWRKRLSACGKAAYKAQAVRCDKLIMRHHAAIERKIIQSNSVSGFFKYVGGKLNSFHKVAPLHAADGKLLQSDADKAEALNAYFASVFTVGSVDVTNSSTLPECNANVSNNVNFSTPAVLSALRNAKHTLSSGPDGIPSTFWSKLASALCFPVSIIFTSSYLSSRLPNDWKHAIVVPVFKKGDASLTKNYRPISLTCTLCKVMETMIKDNMLGHLINNNLLDPSQHGFLPSHSTSSQLLESSYDWFFANDKRFPVDATIAR